HHEHHAGTKHHQGEQLALLALGNLEFAKPVSFEFEFEWVVMELEIACNPVSISDEHNKQKWGFEHGHEKKLAYERDVGKLKHGATKVAASLNLSDLKHAIHEARHKKKPSALLGLFQVGISNEWEKETKDKRCKVGGKVAVVAGMLPFQMEFAVSHKYLDVKEADFELQFHYKISLGLSKKALLLLMDEFEEALEFVEAFMGSEVFAALGIVVAVSMPVLAMVGLGSAQATGAMQGLCWAYALGYTATVFARAEKRGGCWASLNRADPEVEDKRDHGARQALADARKCAPSVTDEAALRR